MSIPRIMELVVSSSARTSAAASPVSTALAKGRLGIWSVVFFVVAAAAPLTVVAGGATTGFAVTGSLGIPISYVAIAAILALFAVGYVAMSRHVVNAGAFYTYISRGLGRVLGVGSAMVAVYAYLAMGVGLYGGLGVVASGYLTRFGLNTPWWLCALVGLVLVGILGLLRVDINGKVLAFLLVSEVAIAVIYDVVMLQHPDGGTVSLATLAPSCSLKKPRTRSEPSPAPPTSPSRSPVSSMEHRHGPCQSQPAQTASWPPQRRTAPS
jgi:amino acid transporter